MLGFSIITVNLRIYLILFNPSAYRMKGKKYLPSIYIFVIHLTYIHHNFIVGHGGRKGLHNVTGAWDESLLK